MAYGQRIYRTLATALLASAPLVAWQAPPPRLTWYETVGSALGLAEVQPTEIADQAPRQRAADALRAVGADPTDCELLGPLKPGEKVTAGFPILEQCAIYRQPGVIQQPGVKWDTAALFFFGVVLLIALLGAAAAVWLIRERRAMREFELGRPDDIPAARIKHLRQPRVRLLPSRVRLRIRLPWM